MAEIHEASLVERLWLYLKINDGNQETRKEQDTLDNVFRFEI